MATDSEHISADEANVLLLAMSRLDNFIDSGACPWVIYDGGENDPKATRAGYMSLIGAVRGKLSRIIDAGLNGFHAAAWIAASTGETTISAMQTWTFCGHWENDRIVVEYALPGDQEDQRIDLGHWEQGLWAAPASAATMDEAQAAAIAEYEQSEED